MGTKEHTKEQAAISRAFTFLKKQDTAVIATVDVEGRPHNSVIYYVVGRDLMLHFVTKSSTVKYKNMLTNPYVSICVYDESKRFTIQATGKATELKEEDEQIEVLNELAKVRHNDHESWLPPISKLKAGKLVVVRVELSGIRLSDFAHFADASKHDVIEDIKVG